MSKLAAFVAAFLATLAVACGGDIEASAIEATPAADGGAMGDKEDG